MNITRTSMFTGITRTLDIPITQEQYDDWAQKRKLIQEAMPHLTLDQREFIMTGVTSDEWDDVFPERGNNQQ